MRKNNFVSLASVVFLIIGIVHIIRLLIGWQVQIAGYMVPMWIYWVEALFFLWMASVGFRLGKRE